MTVADIFRPAEITTAATEQEVRVELAACYRLIAHFGMDDLVHTHISARVPGEPGHFLINPYGLMFHEISASSLVKIDYDGKAVSPTNYPVNQAGFVIHSAVHSARKDVNCVLHTHTRAGVAVSCMGEGLLPLNQFSLEFHGHAAYHDYEGVALDLDERERLVADLGDKNVMILRSHGLLTAGATVPEAFVLMYYLEQSCRVQVDVMAASQRPIIPPPEVCDKAARQMNRNPGRKGHREWPGLLRLLDSKDPSYRH